MCVAYAYFLSLYVCGLHDLAETYYFMPYYAVWCQENH